MPRDVHRIASSIFFLDASMSCMCSFYLCVKLIALTTLAGTTFTVPMFVLDAFVCLCRIYGSLPPRIALFQSLLILVSMNYDTSA